MNQGKVTVLDVLKAANRHYPDGYLENYFDDAGEFVDGSGDTLAEFIVRELSQTVPDYDDPEERLSVARGVLVQAKQDLNNAVRGIEELSEEFYDELGEQ